MSAACNTCGNLGRACGECVITVTPGEQNSHWVPMPARPFHDAACALVAAAEAECKTCPPRAEQQPRG
jgi:hypothetical protein